MDGLGQGVDGIDAEHGVVLAGEGLLAPVLTSGGGPHRHRSRSGGSHLAEPGGHAVERSVHRGIRDHETDWDGQSQSAQTREAGGLAAVPVVGDLVELDGGRYHREPTSASTISASASTAMGPGW